MNVFVDREFLKKYKIPANFKNVILKIKETKMSINDDDFLNSLESNDLIIIFNEPYAISINRKLVDKIKSNKELFNAFINEPLNFLSYNRLKLTCNFVFDSIENLEHLKSLNIDKDWEPVNLFEVFNTVINKDVIKSDKEKCIKYIIDEIFDKYYTFYKDESGDLKCHIEEKYAAKYFNKKYGFIPKSYKLKGR